MKEINEALGALRETASKFGADHAETKAMFDKTNKAFEEQEAKNQKVVADLAIAQKAAEENTERLMVLELELSRKNGAGATLNYKESPEYKALNRFAREGIDSLEGEEKALLRSDSGTDGGYLTMPEMDTTIIKAITEISPVRQVARVRTVSRNTLQMPTRIGIPVANYEGEAEPDEESQSKYGAETMTVHRLSVTVPFTKDLMLDSQFDIESEIVGDVTEAMAFGEGRNFVLGDGKKKPQGFLSDAAGLKATSRESGASGQLSGDDILLLTGDLKVGYDPRFAMNRRTLVQMRILKGSDGHYLWQPGLNGVVPNQLAGYQYTLMNDMPDIAANAFALVFADFRRGYQIVDRTGMDVIRDNVTKKHRAIIEMTFHRYNHGQVILPEAFKLLKIKA
ncbi:phage major capsid protein [Lysobacter sp. GCM10012299]|uniref:phage major capsid protein n=1 Tax=Lysobacter sp. GCM10012299 TaxID=3317333 RepID=UPI0036072C83